MKINPIFFVALLIAYDNLCRDHSIEQTNEDVQAIFYRRLMDAIWEIQGSFRKREIVENLASEYPILEKVVKPNSFVDILTDDRAKSVDS